MKTPLKSAMIAAIICYYCLSTFIVSELLLRHACTRSGNPFMSSTCEVNECMLESMAIQLNVVSVPAQGPRASPVRGHAQASDYMKVATGRDAHLLDQCCRPAEAAVHSAWRASSPSVVLLNAQCLHTARMHKTSDSIACVSKGFRLWLAWGPVSLLQHGCRML